MSKTGLKTFVFSFGLTLSAILGIDKAFFYTPETAKETLKIPRKNITLFFSQSHPAVSPSQVEPVDKVALKTPEYKPKEIEIAQNIPRLSNDLIVRESVLWPDREEIPIQMAALDAPIPKDQQEKTIEDSSEMPDVPLVYSGTDTGIQSVSNAQKVVNDTDLSLQEDLPNENKKVAEISSKAVDGELLMRQPMVIQGTRQIIKIDNLKARQEQKSEPEKENASALDVLLAKKTEEIPLQNIIKNPENKRKIITPPENQIASLGGGEPLAGAEKQLKTGVEGEKKWQTMEEKHQGENPWVVARGSRFAKNKQVLKEDFASEGAKKKAEVLLSPKKEGKSVKVAVQDNILIPIPQDILDEDNLVPTLGGKEVEKTAPKSIKKKAKSFLDGITSVFSKENKQRAIKNIKEQSNKNKNAGKDESSFQILPTEIRLSFQPNRAEISGQTLRWIQAFAKKASEEDGVGLEIRIDGSKSFELQQKRLNLLHNILKANGVSYQKINTLFVDREPNSFVVRTVKLLKGKEEKEDNSWKKYYQKW